MLNKKETKDEKEALWVFVTRTVTELYDESYLEQVLQHFVHEISTS